MSGLVTISPWSIVNVTKTKQANFVSFGDYPDYIDMNYCPKVFWYLRHINYKGRIFTSDKPEGTHHERPANHKLEWKHNIHTLLKQQTSNERRITLFAET